MAKYIHRTKIFGSDKDELINELDTLGIEYHILEISYPDSECNKMDALMGPAYFNPISIQLNESDLTFYKLSGIEERVTKDYDDGDRLLMALKTRKRRGKERTQD